LVQGLPTITKKLVHTQRYKAHNVQHTNKVTNEHGSMADRRPTWLDNNEGYYRFRPKAAKRGSIAAEVWLVEPDLAREAGSVHGFDERKTAFAAR
jgi:hypothetical protein